MKLGEYVGEKIDCILDRYNINTTGSFKIFNFRLRRREHGKDYR
jgi:hypothetical protein